MTVRAGLVLLLISALIAGCSPMASIDRRIQRLVDDRSASLGPDARPAQIRDAVQASYETPGQYEKEPPTTNPSAEEILFEPETDLRIESVLERLDRYSAESADAIRITLEDAWRIAQNRSREYIRAEEDYILSAIRLLIERHRWGPRFFDDVTFSTDFDAGGGNDTAAMNVINDLRVTQLLPYGGELEARLITQATQQLTGIVGDQYVQSTDLVLSANIPLLRDAGLIAQEDLIQAERDLVYAAREFERFRRSFLVSIAEDYFDLVLRQDQLVNENRRLESIALLREQTEAKVQDGRVRAFEARNVEQNVLSSTSRRNSSREALIVAEDRFKIRLGIPVEWDIELEGVTLDLPQPATELSAAVRKALDYRLDYQNQRDSILDSRRVVANARNQILPDLDLTLASTFSTDDDDDNNYGAFDLNDSELSAAVTLGLPLDREIERLNLRSAVIALRRDLRDFDETTDQIILDVRSAVREIDRSRSALILQEDSVRLNELRLEQQRIDEANTTAQERLDTENELLATRNARDSAVRDLRIAILRYLLATGQLRVSPLGIFRPIAGMGDIGLVPEGSGVKLPDAGLEETIETVIDEEGQDLSIEPEEVPEPERTDLPQPPRVEDAPEDEQPESEPPASDPRP